MHLGLIACPWLCFQLAAPLLTLPLLPRFRAPLVPATAATAFAAAAEQEVLDPPGVFEIEPSTFTSEEAVSGHLGSAGDPAEVHIVRQGEGGLYAARSTLRVAVPALELYKWLTDPAENARIFSKRIANVNSRKLLEEDKRRRTRLFEVSKTGKFRLIGIPLMYESTVFALEDWEHLEIRFWQIRPGAMKHSSGLWRIIPSGPAESVVLFYSEAVPAFPLPAVFRTFAGRVVRDMANALLEDLRAAALAWDGTPHKWQP